MTYQTFFLISLISWMLLYLLFLICGVIVKYKSLKEYEAMRRKKKEPLDIEDVYICDPKKNNKCRKKLCQKECFFTKNKKYSKYSINIADKIKEIT